MSFPKKIHKWLVRTEQNLYVCVCAQLCPTPRILAHQAPLSVEFPRQEYGSGLPIPPQGIFQTQGLNP